MNATIKTLGTFALVGSLLSISCAGSSVSSPEWKAFQNGGIKAFEGMIDDMHVELVLRGSRHPASENIIKVDGYEILRKSGYAAPVSGNINLENNKFEIYDFYGGNLSPVDKDPSGKFEGVLTATNKLEGKWVSHTQANLRNGVRSFSSVEKPTINNSEVLARLNQAKKDFDSLGVTSLPNEPQPPAKPSPPSSGGSLSNASLERALNKWILSIGSTGTATVIGIQENAQNNTARADIKFMNFRFKARGYGGVNQEDFSGGGLVHLSKYNDGRWILASVYTNRGVNSNWWENIGQVIE